MTIHRIESPFGTLAVRDSGGAGTPLLLIHGNSGCKEVFDAQFAAPALQEFRLIAPDLPGHGASDDAPDPQSAYTFAGYAGAMEAVLEALNVEAPIVFGWSLGGHIALEMLGRGTALRGVMISGTPPVKPVMEDLMAAFNIDPEAENLTAKRDFSDADAVAFGTATSAGADGVLDPHLLAMVRRTDGLAREIMFTSVVMGAPLDEREIVANMTVPFAVANGEADLFLKPEFFDGLTAPTLWPQGMLRVPGAGHAPFIQTPEAFNTLLVEFAAGC
jgi:pimeloyl-ACP methyl ester carboxylesterase